MVKGQGGPWWWHMSGSSIWEEGKAKWFPSTCILSWSLWVLGKGAVEALSETCSYAKRTDSKSNISDKLHKLGCLLFMGAWWRDRGDLDDGVMSGSSIWEEGEAKWFTSTCILSWSLWVLGEGAVEVLYETCSYAKRKDSTSNISDKLHKLGCLLFMGAWWRDRETYTWCEPVTFFYWAPHTELCIILSSDNLASFHFFNEVCILDSCGTQCASL